MKLCGLLSTLIALIAITGAPLAHGQEPPADLEAWEAESGDDHDDPGRYEVPLVSAGYRYPRLRRPGQIMFFTGLGVAGLFGGVGAAVYVGADSGGIDGALTEVAGAALMVVGGAGALTMITGGILWGVGSLEHDDPQASFRVTPDGFQIAF